MHLEWRAYTKMCASVIPLFTKMKQQKSTFNSYNLFLVVILIHNMVNVFLIAQILRFTLRARIHKRSGKKPLLSGQPS